MLRVNAIPENVDLGVVLSQMTAKENRERTIWRGVCNTKHEAEIQGKHSVSIPRLNLGLNPTSRTRGEDWQDPTQVSQNNIIFTAQLGYQDSRENLWEDIDEASYLQWLAQSRAQMQPGLVKEEDKEIGEYVKGLNYDNAVPSKDNNWVGTPKSIDLNGTVANDAVKGSHVKAALLEVFTQLYEDNLIDGDAILGGAYSTDWTAVLRPRLFKLLIEDMDEKNYQWDRLTEEFLLKNAIASNTAFRGRLHGINIVSHNSIPAATSGKKEAFYVMTPDAVTMARKTGVTQMFDPSNNPVSTKPAYLTRMVTRYGRMLLERRSLVRVQLGANKA